MNHGRRIGGVRARWRRVLGAVEVGMLRALVPAGYRPDVVVGTSIGAVNGALVAADPSEASPTGWSGCGRRPRPRRLRRLDRPPDAPVRRPYPPALAAAAAPAAGERAGRASTFADLKVPFRCCAASIERAAEHWFDSGRWSTRCWRRRRAGLLPPMEIGGEHFVDGGIVNSIPIGEAVRSAPS
jgi:NTE family protein